VPNISSSFFNPKFKSFVLIHKSKSKKFHLSETNETAWFWSLRGIVVKNKEELTNIQIKQKWDNEQIAF
jgi:hypothetical protein